MALNPIVFTEKVVRSFLRYQLTAYPFADERLHAQMRRLLSLDQTRHSPLLKGPYVSLSRPFRQGAAVDDLVHEGVFHPHMRQRIPAEITHVYGHQEDAIRAIRDGRTTLVSTGTGSGKTECFLYPIVSRCLELRDAGAPTGISAVIVYPMNALAEDQLGRLRSLLAGTGISFGMYVGKTPERESNVAGIRLPAGASRADYEARLAEVRREKRSDTVYPPEEICSREVMRTPGRQPRILLTNVKQLELLLTRQRDVELFAGARLDCLVFDEAHTFTGAQGAETACLIRRLRAFCGREAQDTVCVATSATIVDREHPDAARELAARFFGVPNDRSADDLVAYVEGAFRQGWPEADAEVTRPEVLRAHVRGMIRGLDEVIARLRRRLRWAMEQIKRLNAVRERQGDLEPEDDALFRRCDALVVGTRQGRTVLVQLRDSPDPETGERYTVKRYESEKVTSEDGSWRHLKVTLKPDNPDFQPIELTCEDEGSVQVVAEMVEVLG